MTQTACMVLTTIFDAAVLDDYCNNLSRHNHLEQATVFVIPDLKTPTQTYQRCRDLGRRGMHIVCPTIEEQEAFLRHIGFPPNLVPHNSDNRRNVGFLMALETRADFTISLDDDNYCRGEEDFFAEHSIVCAGEVKANIVDAETGWFNICDLLNLEGPGTTYARGFPYYARHKNDAGNWSEMPVDIHVNAGLWLGEPDVDAISWLVAPMRTTGFKRNSVALGRRTWSPVNTQNTALRREVLASYYYIKMNYPLSGISIDRYGDILSGYFAQACVRKMNGTIRFGTPLTIHKRNSHNYMKDAANELAGMVILEDLLPWLTEVTLPGANYCEAYESLSYQMEDAVEGFHGPGWNDPARAYFHQMGYCMRKWITCCRSLG